MKALMPTVTMPVHDWETVLGAVMSARAYYTQHRNPKLADEMELVGREIARACRHQARARKQEKKGAKPCG